MARRGPLMVYLAALAALAGIPIHLYWALGGTWGLPGDASTAGLPGLHATNAIVSVLLAARGGADSRAQHALGSPATGPGRADAAVARLGGVRLTLSLRAGHQGPLCRGRAFCGQLA
ncbi:MAG: hypothetical protein ACRDPF_29065 [Streptosporangiaceae bacterium]